MSDNTLITFKTIVNFINDLSTEFAKKHKPLKLYRHLINKTQICHDEVIKKHIKSYQTFCIANRDAFAVQDYTKFQENVIQYSEKVYINMKNIFEIADNATKPIIWRHLLTISALVDPAGKAKEILKKNLEEGKASGAETNALNDMITNLEKDLSPDANPMDAMNKIMGSGFIQEMFSGMSSGQLDMTKMVGAIQGLVSSLESQIDPNDQEGKNALNMVTGMTNALSEGKMPDMTGVMGMLGNMHAKKN